MSLVFFAFVIYPICYGLWLGGQPELYSQLFADPALPDRGAQHGDLRRRRREPEDGPGLPAVRLLHAQALVDQGAAGRLHPAVGDAGAACLHVDPLVDERPVGHAEQLSCTCCSASTGRSI